MTSTLERLRPATHAAERPARRTTGFRPDVEGLRAVAVLLVVLYHAGVPGLRGGYVGVDVFFVISGFLITGLLLREFATTGRISIAGFYARRARRILPIASVVLVATLGASSILLTATRTATIARDGLWTALFGANVHFAALGTNYLNATAAPSPLQHYWSLAVEEQFYLVWPALLWAALAVSKRRIVAAATTAVLVVASLAWSVVQTGSDANAAYFSPFTRGWELGLGALVAFSVVAARRLPAPLAAALGWTGLAAIAVAAVGYDSTTAFPGSAALLPVLGAVAVLVGGAARIGYGPDALLTRAPMQRLGGWSYSLYLWHWPILMIALERHPGLGLAAKLGLVVVAVALSAATFRWLENPVRRSPQLTRSVRRSLLGGALAIGVATIYCGMYVVGQRAIVARAQAQFALQNRQAATIGTPASATAVRAAVAAGAALRVAPATLTPPAVIAAHDVGDAYSDGCLAPAPAITSPDCTFGDPNARSTVVLFGDSHAAAWLPALQNSASRGHFRVVLLAKGNCPAPDITVYSVQLKRAFTECTAWRTRALARVAALKPSLVVVASSFHGARLPGSGVQTPAVEAAWEQGLATTLTRLRAAARRVIVLGDPPSHQQSLPDCVAAHSASLRACDTPAVQGLLLAHENAQLRTTRQAGATYLATRSWFCTAQVCPAVVHGIITDFDTGHLTTTYAKYLGHVLGLALGLER